MAEMTKIERVLAVVDGQQPDRTPVSFWHHFPPDAEHGKPAVDAHLKFLQRFDLDFLKVMNDNPYPARVEVKSAADLKNLPVLKGDEENYARQLDLIRALADELSGQVLLSTTLFNAWTILRRVVTPRTAPGHNPPTLHGPIAPPDQRLAEFLARDRTAVAMAVDAIAASQANFAARCIDAGADGIFLSVRDDWVDTPANGEETYDELVRLGDGQILAAAKDARLNMLHVCGVAKNFDAFADYGVHAINWADRAAGPAIKDVIDRVKPAVCGGVDNLETLPDKTPADVENEVADALHQAGDRPIMISAGCTYAPDRVPEENLLAIVAAARRTA